MSAAAPGGDDRPQDAPSAGPFPPPGALRVIALMIGIALRRWGNRLATLWRRRARPGAAARRGGTPRRQRRNGLVLALVGALVAAQCALVAVQFIGRAAEEAVGEGAVSRVTYAWLSSADPSLAVGAEPQLRAVLLQDAQRRHITAAEAARRADALLELWRREGAAGFAVVWEDPLSLPRLAALTPEQRRRVVGAVALLFTLIGVGLVLLALGVGNADLGRSEWALEWLFAQPIAGRVLLAARLGEYAVVNPLLWCLVAPLAAIVLAAGGWGWWALAGGLAVAASHAAVVAAVRLIAESWLRLHAGPGVRKNVQAVCTLAGLLLYFGAIWLATSPRPAPDWLRPMLQGFPAVDPFSVAARLIERPPSPLPLAALLAVAVAAGAAAVTAAASLLRRGLFDHPAAWQGHRGTRRSPRALPLGGVLGKDLLLLLRDRSLLVQTLVVPVLIMAMQAAINPDLLDAISSGGGHAAAYAFALGAYVLVSSAMPVLAVEGHALWLTLCAPRPLHRLLAAKALLWAAIAGTLALAALALLWAGHPPRPAAMLRDVILVGGGVAAYAFIAAGLGALATDPLEREAPRKVDPASVYLFMLLAALYGYAIYTHDPGRKAVMLALALLLAAALWQKLRERIPYLLDPVAAPPRRLEIADGLAATLVYFVVQGLVLTLAAGLGLGAGPALVAASAIGGAVASAGTLAALARARVPRLAEALGLRLRRGSALRALALGAGAGVGAFAIAVLWILALRHAPALRGWAPADAATGAGVWLWVAACVCAPLCEEFLFRGVLLGGMRRAFAPAPAILAAATVFALVHRPESMPTALVLGVASGAVYLRTRWLPAAVCCHAVYNAGVLLAWRS